MDIPTFAKIHETAHNIVFFVDGGVKSVRQWMCSDETDRLIALAYQAGKLNYQVENGGFTQYFDNGYADGEESWCANAESKVGMECHHKLIEDLNLFKDQIVTTQEEANLFDVVMNILVDFTQGVWVNDEEEIEEHCNYCDGCGEVPGVDTMHDDEADWETCPECDGQGFIMEYNENFGCIDHSTELKWDRLSSHYYEVNAQWMEMLDRFFKKAVDERPELIDN